MAHFLLKEEKVRGNYSDKLIDRINLPVPAGFIGERAKWPKQLNEEKTEVYKGIIEQDGL
ncbi:MAG: hypothetical protein JRI32_09275 [Deltaproteobacteria bacterium]|nr:hypothetical protein [Deltaproteobacteria bacterium]